MEKNKVSNTYEVQEGGREGGGSQVIYTLYIIHCVNSQLLRAEILAKR